MIEPKNFNGIMDTDSPNETIRAGSIKMGRNIKFRGVNGNWRVENLEGTTPIAHTLPAGNNECIGAFYDDLRQRIIYCNYNSNSEHQINILDISALTVTALVVSGTNTDGDILNFTLDGKIYDMKILYGDSQQGDTIYFNNSQKQPCQINIERTIANTYGVLKRDYLEVIKFPANRPPYVTYGDDTTVTVNTMRRKLFRFMTRPKYFSREKSVVSIRSELPLPINALDTVIDADPTKNCKISIVYETLGADVEEIEIIGQVSGKTDENGVLDPNAFSDPFLIQTINKADLSLADNDIAIFDFYNNQAYTEIDPEDAIQLFDLVPLEANSFELLNGNVPIYGAITEGFDLIDIDATVTPSTIPRTDTQLPYVFVGSQSGDSAFGTGDIHIIVVGTIAIGYVFTFVTTNETITYNAAAATTTDVISGLSAAAVTAGFTVVSSDTQNLVITKTGESLQMVVRQPPVLASTNEMVFNWNDKMALCLNYFDKAGRSAGSQTIEDMSFSTSNYTETTGTPNIPQLLLSVNHRPPIDADYFTLAITESLAKLRFRYWVSDSTYKDSTYAYISIENLNTFIENNRANKNKPSDSAFLAYDFATGDRIRFIKVVSGSVNTVYTQKDFSIIGQALSPTINGTVRKGQFIKIALPATSGTFDFGTSDFFNYEIELYTPAQSVANSLNKFREFGERYTIGNAGLSTRYHQGMTQNQTSNLSQPATFALIKGPYYYRDRAINVGAEYKWTMNSYEQGKGRTTMNWNYETSTYTDPNITPGTSPDQDLSGFVLSTNTDRAILNVTTGTYVFRIEGSITVNFNDFGENFAFYLQDSNSVITNLVAMQPIAQGPHTFSFDVTFQMNPNTRLFIFAYSQGDYRNSKSYSLTDIKITRQLPFTVPVIDANYSDYFASAVNSNARPFIEQPDSARVYSPNLLRWGKPNIANTNINEVSRFTSLNFDEVNLADGDIEVLSAENKVLNVLQKRKCGWYGIYWRLIQNSAGQDIIETTNEIITKNSFQPLLGNYGIGNQKGSFTKAQSGYYFSDPLRGQVRRAANGLTLITEKYFGQYMISDIISKYNDAYVRTNGALSKILGYYDFKEEQYVVLCQEGTFGAETIPNNNFSFHETRNGYCCFYDYSPEWIIDAQGKTFSWKNGAVYIHNNTTDYGKFHGVQTYPSVTLVFNEKGILRKIDNTISYKSNFKWESRTNGDIKTSEFNSDTGLQQISALIAKDYEQRGEFFDADLLRDANSLLDPVEALLSGDFLSGTWLEVKLTYYGSNFVFLHIPFISEQQNTRNF